MPVGMPLAGLPIGQIDPDGVLAPCGAAGAAFSASSIPGAVEPVSSLVRQPV